MNRDVFKFLSGFAAAMTFIHVVYAAATASGTVSVPMWRGRPWGVGKMLVEAVVYGSVAAGLGYLGFNEKSPQPATAPAETASAP